MLDLSNVTGAIGVLQRAALPGAVGALAISPTRRFLYASLRSEPFSAAGLELDPATGRLRLLAIVPLPDNAAYLSVDKTGRFLFGASYAGSKIWVHAIADQGLIEPRPVQVIPTLPRAHAIISDPSNRFVLVPSLGGDVILQFVLDTATGQLRPNVPPAVGTKKGAGPRHLVFHPNTRFAYATNELDASVGAYGFDGRRGTLTAIGSWSLLPPDFEGTAPFAAADLHITPDGRYLYASERASSTIGAFRIDGETGALTSIGSVPTERQPRGFNIDPRGRYLLVAGQASHCVTSYAVDGNTGRLTPRHRTPIGENPNWVEIIDLPGL